MTKLKTILTTSVAFAALSSAAYAQDCPIKVGVLHSLSCTMAISETTLKETMMMLVEDQNAKGGVLGCELEAVVVDPASDWPLFAEKARELLTVHDVDVIFGNWTSVSRKSVLPVIEELERPAVLSCSIRGRRKLEERVLHRCSAQPAGDPGHGLFP